MKKRVLSMLMALALCLTLLPASAWAAETAETNVAEVTSGGTTTQYADLAKALAKVNTDGGAQEQCSCITLCTEGNTNSDCPVCGAEGADLTACKGTSAQEGIKCICTVPCAEGAVNTDCPVCGIEGADLTQCQSEANAITVEKVQELIDALPTTDKFTAMTKDEQNAVYADLQAAYEAYQALTEDEQALLTGTEVFESLFHFFNGMVNLLATANGVSYLDENGDEQTAENVTEVESSMTAWNGGWYVVNGAVTIGSRVAVSGEVHLILADNASLTVNGGINVAEGNSFSVYAQSVGENMGTLTATGGPSAAGIGGGYLVSGGNITISGGSVTATGGGNAAGIGSGKDSVSGGNIIIHGGTVKATGGSLAAGIGGGNSSSGGTITIHGGNVTATGIGGGYSGSGGEITIHGGTVKAAGGSGAAGIGGGRMGSGGKITINGGNVTASGGEYAAGIGGGEDASGGSFATGTDGHALIVASSISDKSQRKSWSGMIFEGDTGEVYGNPTIQENIEIPSGKTLTVSKNTTLTVNRGVTLTNNGKIINNGKITNKGTITGSGTVEGNKPFLPPPPVSYRTCDENGQNWKKEECSNYTVVDGSMTAWSDGWYVVNSPVTIDSRVSVSGEVHLILADGASLTANGGINVARGNSFTVYAQSVGEKMGTLTATGENGAGIGGRNGDKNGSSCGNITIHGGSVAATGGDEAAGIGGGVFGSGGNITINGGTVTATSGDEAAGIGGGWKGSGGNITINGGNVTATSVTFAAGIGGGQGGSGGNITINGGNVTATSEAFAAGIGGGQESSGGNITINGGTVTATGGQDGAGIGSGSHGSYGTITINGGSVTATGGDNGAGIGGGIGDEIGGYGGSFTTGTDGHALIVASSISDKSQRKSWSGMIFEGDTGEVYGNPTIQENIEIPSGKTLTVSKNTTLTVNRGVTLTNNGKIINNGKITNKGTITGSGTVEGNKPFLPPPPVSYRTCDENGQNWKKEECSNYTVVDGSMTAWSDGWYVVNSPVTIDSRVSVSGEVHLILADGASLTANGGINVARGNSFTVYAQSVGEKMGTLTATGENGAGIGGRNGDKNGSSCGNITIHGGSVAATGGDEAAGIGGGVFGSGGNITINGGTVTATSGDEAAGIGGGWKGSGGNITINGGNVTATSVTFAAGIGGGQGGSGGNDGAECINRSGIAGIGRGIYRRPAQ